MFDAADTFVNEEFYAETVTSEQYDELLAQGWRHFGTQFFRYNLAFHQFDIRRVIPLRIRLSRFSLTKSQRRLLHKNFDLDVAVRPIEITREAEFLFHRHKQRFNSGVPDSIYDFLSDKPASLPTEGKEIAVYDSGELVAVSYFDVGRCSVSGIYAMFEPTIAVRGLGIYTMLKEIEFAIESGREFYYQGYSYEGESFYDYKKRFRGTEAFDWKQAWEPLVP